MADKPRVLIIEDEADVREALQVVLSDQFDVTAASDGVEGLRLARELEPKVVLLDVVMPDLDGFSVCKRLRDASETRHLAVIMLTALNDPEEKVRAFKAGADDYIPKPFHTEELIARIESKLRRIRELPAESTDSASDPVIHCGNLRMNTESLDVLIDNRPVELSLREFNLLKYLIENKGKLRSRRQIVETLWDQPNVSDRLLDPYVLSLRKKTAGFNHSISVVYGGGYILKPGEPSAGQNG